MLYNLASSMLLFNFKGLSHVCLFFFVFFSILKSIEFSTSEESGDGEKMVRRFFFLIYVIHFNFRAVTLHKEKYALCQISVFFSNCHFI